MSDCVYNFAGKRNYVTKSGKELTPFAVTPIDLKTLYKSRMYEVIQTVIQIETNPFTVFHVTIFIITSPDQAQC